MREFRPALISVLLYVVLTGGVFPLSVSTIAQILFPDQANGSFVRDKTGKIVGSSLIGQGFSSPKYFHPRPSAAGAGYDPTSSGGTNLGPISSKLIEGIKDDSSTPVDESYAGVRDLAVAYRSMNGLAPDALLPADAVTRSASGLDPHISPENAMLQSRRVAQARGISSEIVKSLIHMQTEPRFLGLWGEPRVNVLQLNLALDREE